MNTLPKCYECDLKLQGREMKEIGQTGRTVQIMEELSSEDTSKELRIPKAFGVRGEYIYQCELCKTIKIQ